jgi:hypothetical protein
MAFIVNPSDDNDTLYGDHGADALDGGSAATTASYSTSSAGVTVSLLSGAGSQGEAQGVALANLATITGTHPSTMFSMAMAAPIPSSAWAATTPSMLAGERMLSTAEAVTIGL